MRHPWLKFYPSDWQSDQALGVCSLAARGLWMEMLAIMHKADPYGHLLVNGKSPTEAQLASIARCPLDQIPSLLDELESAGVFSRTRTRAIYSRRLTRDEKRRKDGERAAKEGALPDSKRTRQATKKKEEKSLPPRLQERVNEQAPQHPEARSQKLDAKEISQGIDKILSSLGTAKRPSAYARPNYDDPAERKARWQQKIMDEIRRTISPEEAGLIIASYAAGEREGKQYFEMVDQRLKARRSQTENAA